MIIALEGMDCTGKTTQSELLVERLTKAGFKAHVMSFPRKETDIGKVIYKRFFDLGIASRSKKVDRYALELLLEADRYEAQQKIGELLEMYQVLVLDRYVLSGLVYAMASGVDLEWRLGLRRFLTYEPDLTIVLDMPAEEGMKRRPLGRDGYEADLAFQNRVRSTYLAMAKMHEYPVIHACGTVPEVHAEIWKHVSVELFSKGKVLKSA